MNKVLTNIVLSMFFLTFFVSSASAALLDANEIGFGNSNRSNNYDELLNSLYSNNNVVTTIGDKMWVPWFKTSSSAQVSDLQSGSNCNSGQIIDFTHNCMVTDEYSQVGVLTAMGNNQIRMTQFYNTVLATKSNYGNIPAWRIYRNGNIIEPCKSGINGNCDTASDATARIIIALYTASENPLFSDETKKSQYSSLATILADDMLNFEVEKTCRPTNYGTVCNWLAGGSNVKSAGISSNDFAYTGYYADAIIAMLAAYEHTGDVKYYNAAKDFTLNYMQAARFNGQTFTVPPGKSFKWTIDSTGKPQAECTNTCNPVIWDGYDASRALGMCQALYYANEMNVDLPQLEEYCKLLNDKYMTNPNSAPLQFYPNGNAGSYQSGYFAQGLQALHQSGVNSELFELTIDSALAHYSTSSHTFDNAPAFGVYTTTFAVRALGMGIGRDSYAFGAIPDVIIVNNTATANTTNTTPNSNNQTNTNSTNTNTTVTNTTNATNTETTTTTTIITTGIASLSAKCTYGTSSVCSAKSDSSSGVCRTVIWSTAYGDIKIFACEKDNNYVEIYKQTAPTSITYKVCLANGCITQNNGFARFIPTITTTTTTTTTNTNTNTTGNTNTTNTTITNSNANTTENTTTGNTNNTTNNTNTNTTNTSGNTITNPTVEGIASLSATCKYGSTNCQLKSDSTSGVCRTILFGTSKGDIKILGCEKGDGYIEVYRQEFPSNFNFDACIDDGCVDKHAGFARVQP